MAVMAMAWAGMKDATAMNARRELPIVPQCARAPKLAIDAQFLAQLPVPKAPE